MAFDFSCERVTSYNFILLDFFMNRDVCKDSMEGSMRGQCKKLIQFNILRILF